MNDPASRASIPSGTVIEQWRIVRVLSVDGVMGQIYEVEHMDRKVPAALKLLRLEFAASDLAVQRAELEAIAGARVQHPNLNAVLAAGRYERRPFLVTPLLDGKNLRAWLIKLGPLPIGEALYVAREVASGLSALHQQAHAIHRDVKPDNIFITYQGEVKLLDLGIAKFLGDSLESLKKHSTRTGELDGTVAYMAPEHLDNEAIFASDIYSLGLVLYEMIAGRYPFADAYGRWPSQKELVQRLLRHESPPPLIDVIPRCPKSISVLVSCCLAQSPAERPGSAETLRDLLERELDAWKRSHPSKHGSGGDLFRATTPAAARVPASAPAEIRPDSARRGRSFALSHKYIWLALGLALLLLAGAVAAWTMRSVRLSQLQEEAGDVRLRGPPRPRHADVARFQ